MKLSRCNIFFIEDWVRNFKWNPFFSFSAAVSGDKLKTYSQWQISTIFFEFLRFAVSKKKTPTIHELLSNRFEKFAARNKMFLQVFDYTLTRSANLKKARQFWVRENECWHGSVPFAWALSPPFILTINSPRIGERFIAQSWRSFAPHKTDDATAARWWWTAAQRGWQFREQHIGSMRLRFRFMLSVGNHMGL